MNTGNKILLKIITALIIIVALILIAVQFMEFLKPRNSITYTEIKHTEIFNADILKDKIPKSKIWSLPEIYDAQYNFKNNVYTVISTDYELQISTQTNKADAYTLKNISYGETDIDKIIIYKSIGGNYYIIEYNSKSNLEITWYEQGYTFDIIIYNQSDNIHKTLINDCVIAKTLDTFNISNIEIKLPLGSQIVTNDNINILYQNKLVAIITDEPLDDSKWNIVDIGEHCVNLSKLSNLNNEIIQESIKLVT